METGISINKHIYQLLTSNEKIKKMVKNNIYPLVAEEDASYPFIIFTKDNITTSYNKDGRTEDTVDFSVNVVAENYFQTVEIGEEIRNTLELKRDDYFNYIVMDSVAEDFAENAYVQMIRFRAIVK